MGHRRHHACVVLPSLLLPSRHTGITIPSIRHHHWSRRQAFTVLAPPRRHYSMPPFFFATPPAATTASVTPPRAHATSTDIIIFLYFGRPAAAATEYINITGQGCYAITLPLTPATFSLLYHILPLTPMASPPLQAELVHATTSSHQRMSSRRYHVRLNITSLMQCEYRQPLYQLVTAFLLQVSLIQYHVNTGEYVSFIITVNEYTLLSITPTSLLHWLP